MYIHTHIPFAYQTGDTQKNGLLSAMQEICLPPDCSCDASFSHGGFKLSAPAAARAGGTSIKADNCEFK